MVQPSASVVVVSQGREALLARCLKALSQQQKVAMEVVVVTSDSAIQHLTELGWAERVKLVRMNEENIAVARNRGICAAAGEIVAFIDDDAVPEPAWLYLLLQAFEQPEIAAATGFTLGRNGISYQWKAETIDASGISHALSVPDDQISVFQSSAKRAIKLIGTNMAFRRSVLVEMNGFDPRYRFYLDDSDLSMRLAFAGRRVAIVPMARVHHAYAASGRRSGTRVPKTLYEIGASQAVFAGLYCHPTDILNSEQIFRKTQRTRLLRHMQSGAIGPEEVGFLTVTMNDGLSDGKSRRATTRTIPEKPESAFRALTESLICEVFHLSCRFFERKLVAQQAIDAASANKIAIVIELSPTALYHRFRYDDAGYWIQSGGIWGRSLRSQPLFTVCSFSARVRAEIRRISDEFWLDATDAGT